MDRQRFTLINDRVRQNAIAAVMRAPASIGMGQSGWRASQ